jgi:hypothetical protein
MNDIYLDSPSYLHTTIITYFYKLFMQFKSYYSSIID